MVSELEIAAAIIEPHFAAARDHFCESNGSEWGSLERLRRTRIVLDPAVHDSERHFGQCRDDGLLIKLAPQLAEEPLDTMLAVICHELGHAIDFLYPGDWVSPYKAGGQAIWIGGRNDKAARRWKTMWNERGLDQVEWAADAIALTVSGRAIRYCGPCLVQCFRVGEERPAGLR